ncbi:MAG: hypothetical protein J6B20_02850, partial [Clostridia bacterium]|nr:hypothetical protein [Clostridia bacterium]
MNNKIFRIILMFLAVCISSISTLFAVSFGLSNLSLGNENQDLTQENEDLNEEVEDLNQIVSDFENMVNNLDEHAAIVTYELDGLIWRIQIVQKNKEFNLPEIAETDEQLFSGWKLNGEGEVLTTALVEADTKFTAEM